MIAIALLTLSTMAADFGVLLGISLVRLQVALCLLNAAVQAKQKARLRGLSIHRHPDTHYLADSRNAFIFNGESVITTSTPNCCALR